jgi:MFS family permease
LFNNIRIIEYWTDYFDDPHGGDLGLLTAMYSIGSIASLPIVPYMSDHWGRKTPIVIGCVIMIIAAAVQASAQSMSAFEGARFFMGFGGKCCFMWVTGNVLTYVTVSCSRQLVSSIYSML